MDRKDDGKCDEISFFPGFKSDLQMGRGQARLFGF